MTQHTAFDVTDKVIWVTGSSRGIGEAIARHLAAAGAAVVVHGRSLETLEPLARELHGFSVTGDVRDPDAMAAAAETILDRYGHLHGVVANVGGAAYGALADTDADLATKMLALNLGGAMNVARAVAKPLAEHNGSLVFISATAATNPAPMFAAYGAAKAGVEHLTRSLAAEWGPDARVNCIAPGLIRTEGSMKALFGGSSDAAERAGSAMAAGRVGEPEDIAFVCHFLLSDAAAYVNGAVIPVDGGPIEGVAQRVMRAMQ
jgi:3-oxoacyl-[acyl-carrier protein] reductase